MFLDRDDTLIRSYGHRPANTPDEVELLNMVPETLRILKKAGFLLLVVSNQAGVARGFVMKEAVHDQNRRLNDLLLMAKAPKIDAYSFCPHNTDEGCSCRKPKPGMLISLAEKCGVDLSRSYMVGDNPTDMQAGRAAGVRGCLLLGRGRYEPGMFDHCDVACASPIRVAECILIMEGE